MICGSGVGASIATNKAAGIRAALCHDTYTARQGVEHNDMNVLCIGGRVIGIETAKEVIAAFIGAEFMPEARFQRRIDKVGEIEAGRLEAKLRLFLRLSAAGLFMVSDSGLSPRAGRFSESRNPG